MVAIEWGLLSLNIGTASQTSSNLGYALASIIQLFRAQKNHKKRFESLLAPHVELMYRMAYRWTQSQEDAEDIVQDVLIKLVDRVDEMLAIEQLRPWLIKIVYRRFVDIYRREQKSPMVSLNSDSDDGDDAITPSQDWLLSSNEQTHSGELEERLTLAIAQLDPEQRDVVLLHFIEGYTALEVAEILDVNPGTVKSRLQRAKNKLKIFLSAGPF